MGRFMEFLLPVSFFCQNVLNCDRKDPGFVEFGGSLTDVEPRTINIIDQITKVDVYVLSDISLKKPLYN